MGIFSKKEPNTIGLATNQDIEDAPVSENSGNAIGYAEILEASQILSRYKGGKAHLEQKIKRNEEFWKKRQWKFNHDDGNLSHYSSAWLWNCIESKHADIMDGFPVSNVLPREPGDRDTAKTLSEILPLVFEANGYEETYSDFAYYAEKNGTAVMGCFWDSSKLNGLGDISIKKIDLLNLFWEPGITDIQDSENIFHVSLVNKKPLEESYPELEGKFRDSTVVAEYFQDENIDKSDKITVVDWYYKKRVNGKTILHYCKYAGDHVLFATENDERYAERGWYDHGKYPFVVMPLFKKEDGITGLGFVDIAGDTQLQLDKLDDAIYTNARCASVPRWLVREDGQINEEEFADFSKSFVHYSGTLTEGITPIQAANLSSIYLNIRNGIIDEIKETTSNRDVNNGGTVSGVTAASGIAALQESAGKVSRDIIKNFYRMHTRLTSMVIELIRQFYDQPRTFRIIGEQGNIEFHEFSNNGLQPQPLPQITSLEQQYRLPVFDIEVSAEKASPYNKMSQNELMLQFYGNGFFNPQMTDQALACLEGMDFNHKEDIENRIRENGTMQQELQKYQQIALSLAQRFDPQFAQVLMGQLQGGASAAQAIPAGSDIGMPQDANGESSKMTKAREQAQDATQPV